MTQNNLNEEIEKELLTYSGTTFTAPSEALGWLHQAMLRIAEKTVEAVRVKKRKYVTQPAKYNGSDANVYREGYNDGLDEQTNLAKRWLGKE